ncbi:MAG TPA: class I SAM-dependent methyltransferase, partial [Acidimicrobiales bacterium]
MANEEMKEGWNGEMGAQWVRRHDSYDRMLAPWAELLAATAAIRPGEHVLDVGCGNGITTREAARAAAPDGTVTGVDLSAPMLAHARTVAGQEGLSNVELRQADAQTDDLAPGGDRPGYDVVVSRFGVMFFDDPVAAFANIRKVTAPGGRLALVTWAPVQRQQWLLEMITAALQHVPPPELPTGPDQPGMFGLSTTERIEAVLEGSGWSDVAVTEHPRPMVIGGGTTLDDAMDYLEGSRPAQM